MNADYVENIIRNIDEKSYTYKCILVDGTWGIGKSYMVRKALEDKKDKAFYVSLFGLESAQQIYHDILYQLLLHTENGGKLVEWFAILSGKKHITVSVSIQTIVMEKLQQHTEIWMSFKHLFAIQLHPK